MKSSKPMSARPGLVTISGIVGLWLTLVSGLQAAEVQPHSGKRPLTLGFFPIISTVALYKRFAPLREYLSASLGREVVLKTAKDFPTFVKRTDARSYDIVVTAPHFAVKASDSGQYRIRATLITDVQQLVVVRSDSSITAISQLAGKRVATPPQRALMTMMGVQHFIEAGLSGARAPIYRPFTSHNAANEAVLGGEADAAIASSNIVKKAVKRGEPFRIISGGLKLPNMATLVATDMDAQIGNRMVQALVGMKASTDGQQTLKRIALPGYRAVSASDYEPARPYMEQGTARLSKTNY